MNDPPDKIAQYERSSTNYRSIETSWESIVKYPESSIIIENTGINVNKIIIHAYHFFKLFTLDKHRRTGRLPAINKRLLKSIMKIVSTKDARGSKPDDGTQELLDELSIFYEQHYKSLLSNEDKPYLTNLNTLLDYEAESMITCIGNHIKNNFYDFFSRYVNVMVDKKGMEKYINKTKSIENKNRKTILNNYRNELRKLKTDILKHENLCFDEFENIKTYIRDTHFYNVDDETNIIYQVNDDPFDFLKILINMSKEIENKHQKTFSCFPLRKSIIPKHIKLDTTTIIQLLFKPGENKSFYLSGGNTIIYKDYIWSLFFRTERKFFKKKNYIFNNQITTDGISCSILFIRKDLYKVDKRSKPRHIKKPFGYKGEKYIDELSETEKEKFKDYTVVGIDPNKDDLIYATTITSEENSQYDIKKFRYTQNQRRKETKSKKYHKIIERNKKNTFIMDKRISDLKKEIKEYVTFKNIPKWLEIKKHEKEKNKNNFKNKLMEGIKNCKRVKELKRIFTEETIELINVNKIINNNINNSASIKDLETMLSHYNSKSCEYNNVINWIKIKNKINSILQNHYEDRMYRKFRWNGKINKKKSEDRMLINFKKKFGDPNKVLIAFGDYEQRKQMKFKEPTKGKSFRKLFRKAGYNLFLVEEYNTSKMNFFTQQENEKFKKRESPRPWRKNKMTEVHGLLRSKCVTNGEPTKYILVNRDLNASLNIRLKALCALKNQVIPEYLRRN